MTPPFTAIPADTTPEAFRIYCAALRALTFEERAERTAERSRRQRQLKGTANCAN
jgi:hypothetical protein